MLKPNSLRDALTAAIPSFVDNPDALRMWIDKGRIVARQSRNLAFEYRYTLSVVIQDWTGHPSVIFLAINRWLELQQPDLLAGQRTESYSFEADIIDSQTVDLSIEIPLTESVAVVDSGGGQFELQHLAEPTVLFPDDQAMAPLGPPLTSIWYQGQQLVPEAI